MSPRPVLLSRAAAPVRRRWPLPLLLTAAFAGLYARLFFFPAVPVLPWGDEIFFLLDGKRMLAGQAIYRDFFQLVTPGTSVVYWGLMKLFGVRAFIPNAVMLLLGVTATWLTFAISRRLLPDTRAYLPALLFVAFPVRTILDATHHWFSTVAIAAAVLVVLRGRSARALAGAGALCAVASFFTQHKGAAVLLAFLAFAAWEARGERFRALWRRCAILVGSFAVTGALLAAPFVWQAGWSRVLYCTVIYPARFHSGEWYNSWRAFMTPFPAGAAGRMTYFLVFGTVPLVYVLSLWRCAKNPPQPKSDLDGAPVERGAVVLLSLVGGALFLSVIKSAGLVRVGTACFPALVLLVWLLPSKVDGGSPTSAKTGPMWGTAAVALLTVAALASLLPPRSRPAGIMELPIGRVGIQEARWYEEFAWAKSHLRPGQPFEGNPPIAFAFELQTPGAVLYLSSSRFVQPEQMRQEIAWLERMQPPVMLLRIPAYLPVLPGQEGRYGAPLRAYLEAHYRLTRIFRSEDELWEKVQ